MSKLTEPCPFCGKEDNDVETCNQYCYVCCTWCGTKGPCVHIGYDSKTHEAAKKESIALWNERKTKPCKYIGKLLNKFFDK